MIDSRPTDTFQPGDVLNNTYRIEAVLGRGGTSDVYKARSEISGRLAALKVLKAEFSRNDDYLVLLTREEEIREVRHDAVVRYSENHRTQDGLVYLVMDYVEGPGLDRKLKDGPMAADDLLILCKRVAEGLEAAHKRNIVHRDLSPDNVILRGGDPAQAVIIDFGIAKDTNPGAETIVGNEFAGKYAYAAPEQLSGKTDARSDLYSLGAVLLANFRGKSPDVGRNPIEVVKKKSEPLDTQGVPDPLKTLIDRMAAPEPDDRFQSAADVLAYLREHENEIDPDATIIAPPPPKPVKEPAKPDAPAPAAKTPDPSKAEPTGKKRGGLVGVVLLLAAFLVGLGGYFSGVFDSLLGPKYPEAVPYTLLVEKSENDPPHAVGHVPSEQTLAALNEFMRAQSGTTDIALASGEIAKSWGTDVMSILSELTVLDEWRLAIDGNTAELSGETTDAALQEHLANRFSGGMPGALQGTATIALIPVFLDPAQVETVLAEFADCGPLETPDVPPVGYGPQTDIIVNGKVAETATRIAMFDALKALAGERNIIVDVEVLNPTLCLIESHLPNAPSSQIDVEFSVGDRDEPNPSGRFFVGENPVIDIVLPADVTDGFLTVSILDVSGNVFHLLPNLNRQENAVSTLRDGNSGPVRVRVAYSIAEAAQTNGLAFRVDDSTLGKSKVIVLHSQDQLFDVMRPTSESAGGYAEALQEHVRDGDAKILSLDSRILTTAKP